MDNCVYITRQFNKFGKYFNIYGVYKSEEAARKELLSDEPDLEFDENLWRWENKYNGSYYRIDAYSVR